MSLLSKAHCQSRPRSLLTRSFVFPPSAFLGSFSGKKGGLWALQAVLEGNGTRFKSDMGPKKVLSVTYLANPPSGEIAESTLVLPPSMLDIQCIPMG